MNLRDTMLKLSALCQEVAHQQNPKTAAAAAYAQARLNQAELTALIHVLLTRGFITQTDLDLAALKAFEKQIQKIQEPDLIVPANSGNGGLSP